MWLWKKKNLTKIITNHVLQFHTKVAFEFLATRTKGARERVEEPSHTWLTTHHFSKWRLRRRHKGLILTLSFLYGPLSSSFLFLPFYSTTNLYYYFIFCIYLKSLSFHYLESNATSNSFVDKNRINNSLLQYNILLIINVLYFF